MFELFIPKNFTRKSEALIEHANDIIDEYATQGFKLTLRQLYYQFVARDLLPNTMQSYKRLGNVVSDARLAGRIDWDAIEDRTRNLKSITHWDDPEEIIEGAADSYRIDKWQDQENRVEVWIEKEALVGVIERVCKAYDVAWFACRGYVSQSEQYKAGMRFLEYREQEQQTVILHLGDHDPSGIDMTRDNLERLSMFSYYNVKVKRIALNSDQVKKYKPPPNPAKLTDSRAGQYIRRYGSNSWELDALDPTVIQNLIEDEIKELLDAETYGEYKAKETKQREQLRVMSMHFDEIAEFCKKF